MNISCLPVSLFKELINGPMTIGDWANEAKKIGLDGIDISIAMVKNHTPTYITELQKINETMPVIMATTYPDFTNPDLIQRRRELDYFKADIALCSQLGIKYLRILAGQAHPKTSRSDGIEWALYGMRESDIVANTYGVTLLYENHSKPSAWEFADFSYPIDIFLEIFEGLRDTGIRLNFDIGNISALGLNPLDILPLVFNKVETIHISDMQEVGKFTPVAIGTGVVPIDEIFSYLKKNGFDNWLCIEECSNRGISGIKDAVAFVQKTWKKA